MRYFLLEFKKMEKYLDSEEYKGCGVQYLYEKKEFLEFETFIRYFC